jgi:hypothetical protein
MLILPSRATGLFLAAAGLLAAAAPAVAQPDPDPRAAAKVHVGPLHFTPTLTLADLGWDSNIFNTEVDRASDFTVTLVPRTDAWFLVARRAALKADVATPLVYYHTHERERSANVDLTLRGEAYFRRLTLFAGTSYLNTRQRPNLEIDERVRHLERGVGAGATVRASSKLAIELTAERLTIAFDDRALIQGTSLRDVLNRDEETMTAALRYKLTPLTTVGVRTEVSRDRFPFSPVRDADSLLLLPGIELKPRALVTGFAHIGHRRLRPRAATMPAFAGLAASVGLSHNIAGSTQLAMTFDRDVAFSFEPLEPYFVLRGVGATVRRQVAGPFDVTVGFDRHHYDYRRLAGAAAELPPGDRVDVTRGYTATVGYRLAGANRVGFAVSHWKRSSGRRDARDYSGLRFGTTVTYGF